MNKGTALAVCIVSVLILLAGCKQNIHSTPPATGSAAAHKSEAPARMVEQPQAADGQPGWSESDLVVDQDSSTAEYKSPESAYYVQVGAFTDEVAAMDTLALLLGREYSGSRVMKVLVNGRELYKVQAGAFEERRTADIELGRLRNTYPESFVIRD